MPRTPLNEKMLQLATAERDALRNTVARIEAKIAKHPLTEQLAATKAALAEAEATVAQLGADEPETAMGAREQGMQEADGPAQQPSTAELQRTAGEATAAVAARVLGDPRVGVTMRAGPPTPRTTDATLPELPGALDVTKRGAA